MILNENTDQTKAIMDKCLDEGKSNKFYKFVF